MQPRTGKVELVADSEQPFRRGSQGGGVCVEVEQKILHIKADTPVRRCDML